MENEKDGGSVSEAESHSLVFICQRACPVRPDANSNESWPLVIVFPSSPQVECFV